MTSPLSSSSSRIDLERVGELPRPARERWQPLRVGLLDLFHYDQQEFWFRDGRLLWRGNNGTGKSKVLALTLPFLLDGDVSAHRVEPDGDPGKRMEWNLLLGGRYPERLGYTWIEFGRLGNDGKEHFFTAGIALKAVQGRGIADRWYFGTDRRVGVDLPLLTSTGSAMGRDRLIEAIGERGQVVRTAEHYRRLVDERLFQLGADRYGALVDLLIQLRQPQLSKRPDPQLLSEALSEALTPLDPDLLADAAAGFHDLEQQRDELSALNDTHDHLQRFQRRYTGYAAVAARRQAGDLRKSHAQYEESGRQLGTVRDQAKLAASAQSEAMAALSRTSTRQTELRAVQEQLRQSPELSELDRAREAAEQARKSAEAARRRLTSASATFGRSDERLASARLQTESAAQQREGAIAEAAAIAGEAASGAAHQHAVSPPGGLDDAMNLRRTLNGVADDRSAAVSTVRALQTSSTEASAQTTRAATRLSELESERDAATDTLQLAGERVQQTGDKLVEDWRTFAAQVDTVAVPYPDEVGLTDWVGALDGPEPASAVLGERVDLVRRELASAEALTQTRLGDIASSINDLVVRRAELEAGVPPSPVVPPTRDEQGRRSRAGAPLWQIVDVRDEIPTDADESTARKGLNDAERAGLEAALEASGLLDAWVTPDGRVLAADQLDVTLLPLARTGDGGTTSRTLADLLVPTIDWQDEHASALDEATVEAVLRSVTVRTMVDSSGPADDHNAYAEVGLDGGYRIGPLQGRWAKPVAEYLGASAREQARRARIQALTIELDQRKQEQQVHQDELTRIRAAGDRLTEQIRDRPSDQALRDAHAGMSAAIGQLEQREAALVPAREQLGRAREQADEARLELERTAMDLALPVGGERLELVATALGRYRAAISDLVAAVERHADRVENLQHCQSEVQAARASLEACTDDAERAAEEELIAHTRWATLEESLGATVADLTQRLNATAAELELLAGELPEQQRRHTDATQALGNAEGREQQLLADQSMFQQARDATVLAWRSFAATGLLAVAVPELEVPGPDASWAAEPAVRLARRVESALIETDDSDQAWKRVQDDITRRFTDLGEALSRHGHQAHADLVEGRYVVSILYSGRDRPPAELAAILADEIELRERELTGRERQVLEEHLVGDVAGRLQELITEADELVSWMNAELAERPTSTGMLLRLVWRPDPEGPDGLREARAHLLRQTSQLWSDADRATVRDFLQRQIQRVRAEKPLGTWTEHLRQALDYRGWHEFVIERLQDGAWRSAVGPASGGERVLTVSLPLFAAASAHYRSAHPLAPRLVLLDEAFAGVDDDARAKCLGLLTQFDLDVAMTSEREWGFYATVPGIATYQLVRHDGIDAVHVTAWEWDGTHPRQVSRPVVPPQATGPVLVPGGLDPGHTGEPDGLF